MWNCKRAGVAYRERCFMDWTGCDVVESVPGRLGGQPVVKNSRVTAAAVVESYDLGETVEEISYSFDLDPDDIRKIIGFADEHNPVQQSA
jgi:uncharacterized protein (DUF433 family)